MMGFTIWWWKIDKLGLCYLEIGSNFLLKTFPPNLQFLPCLNTEAVLDLF